jgi:sulfite reductase beta subunit-like hemoprotein
MLPAPNTPVAPRSRLHNGRHSGGQIEAAKRTALSKGEVGIKEKKLTPTLSEFAPRFTAAIETTCAEKPATVSFYKAKLKVLVKRLGDKRLEKIEEAKSRSTPKPAPSSNRGAGTYSHRHQ